MKKRYLILVVFLVLILSTAYAQDKRPEAVSPASEMGIASVGQLCPTFSWTAVDWAEAYRVEVYIAEAETLLKHMDMAASSFPVLVKEILGSAIQVAGPVNLILTNGDLVSTIEVTGPYGDLRNVIVGGDLGTPTGGEIVVDGRVGNIIVGGDLEAGLLLNWDPDP